MSEKHTVIAEKWVQNGYAIAHFNNKPLFLHGALPGETVEFHIVKDVTGHSFGIVTKVIVPSGERTKSSCEAFPRCGGCSFRHVSYENERILKRKLLEELYSIEDCFNKTNVQFYFSERDGYRNHIQIHSDGTDYGFYGLHSRDIIPFPVSGCRNLSNQMNETIQNYSFSEKRTYRFREACEKIFTPDLLSRQNQIQECISLTSPDPGAEKTADFNFIWNFPPDGFFQQNRFLIQDWLNVISEWVPPNRPDTTELFCGNGFIGGFLRKQLGDYAGYEFHENSLKSARKNFKRMNFTGTFQSMDLYGNSPDLSRELVIANPPRSGLKNKILEKLKTRKGTLIYSSCNPHTMNRDLKILMNSGYLCTHSAVFDFFPGTPHLEVVMSLVR